MSASFSGRRQLGRAKAYLAAVSKTEKILTFQLGKRRLFFYVLLLDTCVHACDQLINQLGTQRRINIDSTSRRGINVDSAVYLMIITFIHIITRYMRACIRLIDRPTWHTTSAQGNMYIHNNLLLNV